MNIKTTALLLTLGLSAALAQVPAPSAPAQVPAAPGHHAMPGHTMSTPAASMMGGPSISDLTNDSNLLWMDATSMSNLAEIETSRLALGKSQNPAVRGFAQKMIDHHTVAQRELMALAIRKNARLADRPGAEQRLMYKKLQILSGAAFDRGYMDVQVKGHEATVAFFKDYLSVGRDPDVVAAARKYLPVVSGHLAEAKRIRSQLR
ncbi:putative membrane protein [Deinobacterium chartae]|uniref:Putative membrane protein n=1 Tax=Deinobacterium chartae TaxID=521158 RepID=A0A841I1X1_9DEIO|nr:DUF4142 domain-containing protein [Deinobacterium chartae]MBB6099253.1 putative membrane protein [Deinobacterium chartae]